MLEKRDEILLKIEQLMEAYQKNLLGGERMPEHENPGLDRGSKENYLYFTLPMALNYQRNSYVLWECANRLFHNAPMLFDCKAVLSMSESALQEQLINYKVALQPNKQPAIWKTLCNTFVEKFDGDIRNFFHQKEFEISAIKEYIQKNKKLFPYLGGNKICNYWLYVMEQYTDAEFKDRENITVAPDTHVIQASMKLGVITEEESKKTDVQIILSERWYELLKGTDYVPIDLHTPMWLWSRGKFSVKIIEKVR